MYDDLLIRRAFRVCVPPREFYARRATETPNTRRGMITSIVRDNSTGRYALSFIRVYACNVTACLIYVCNLYIVQKH
jgi:hypothetical protein